MWICKQIRFVYKYEFVDLVIAAAPLTFTADKGSRQLAKLAAETFSWFFSETFCWLFSFSTFLPSTLSAFHMRQHFARTAYRWCSFCSCWNKRAWASKEQKHKQWEISMQEQLTFPAGTLNGNMCISPLGNLRDISGKYQYNLSGKSL